MRSNQIHSINQIAQVTINPHDCENMVLRFMGGGVELCMVGVKELERKTAWPVSSRVFHDTYWICSAVLVPFPVARIKSTEKAALGGLSLSVPGYSPSLERLRAAGGGIHTEEAEKESHLTLSFRAARDCQMVLPQRAVLPTLIKNQANSLQAWPEINLQDESRFCKLAINTNHRGSETKILLC